MQLQQWYSKHFLLEKGHAICAEEGTLVVVTTGGNIRAAVQVEAMTDLRLLLGTVDMKLTFYPFPFQFVVEWLGHHLEIIMMGGHDEGWREMTGGIVAAFN